MEWKKIADLYPPYESEILYSDLKRITHLFVLRDGRMRAFSNFCNDKSCDAWECDKDWKWSPDDYWMKVPDHPLLRD